MRGLIMFKGGVETQEFFSLVLAKTFDEMGYVIFFYNLMRDDESFRQLQAFVRDVRAAGGSLCAFTFNFGGLSGERHLYSAHGTEAALGSVEKATSGNEGLGEYGIYWDVENIPVLNMVLDHPFYYHKNLEHMLPRRYRQISIDRNHEAYMRRFFPKVELAGFLPLAGTRLEVGEPLPDVRNRPMDVVMTGNYTRPETFDRYIAHLDREYIEFYHAILDRQLANPSKTLEEVAEPMLRETIEMDGELTDDDLRECYGNMIFIDLWARFYYRGRAVAALADAGFKVHTFGEGWDVLECGHPENVITHGGRNSRQCLEAIAQSKLSLNVMPWFKDGAHDRIFNTMLNESVCVTDGSRYIDGIMTDGREACVYTLEGLRDGTPDKLVSDVAHLLESPSRLLDMSHSGLLLAQGAHTWRHRAHVLDDMLQGM
jgi:hypothetical protein